MLSYTEKEFKSILNVATYTDNWFWGKYGINPYNGCQFGCIYCDSRSSKYHLPTDFENNIIVKKDPAIMLDKRISKARTLLPDIIGLGGTTDPYQPAERKYRNSRKILEVIEKHKYAVHIITKSQTVLDDVELIKQIAKNAWGCVTVTITTANGNLSRFLETRVSLPENRFKVIEAIKKNHPSIQSGVSMIPIAPFLCDSKDALEEMIKKTKGCGADYILFGSMTFRDVQAKWYFKHLQSKYPELIPKHEKLLNFHYDENTEYTGEYAANDSYHLPLNNIILELCEKYNLPWRIKRFIPNDYRHHNYRIAELLLNHAYLLQLKGKKHYNQFWAGMNIQNLKEDIAAIKERGELKTIRNVGPEMEAFIERYFQKQTD